MFQFEISAYFHHGVIPPYLSGAPYSAAFFRFIQNIHQVHADNAQESSIRLNPQSIISIRDVQPSTEAPKIR